MNLPAISIKLTREPRSTTGKCVLRFKRCAGLLYPILLRMWLFIRSVAATLLNGLRIAIDQGSASAHRTNNAPNNGTNYEHDAKNC